MHRSPLDAPPPGPKVGSTSSANSCGANRPQPSGGHGPVLPPPSADRARGLYFPLEQIVRVFGFLRAPSAMICNFSGIVVFIHRSAMS
jgi:hypothetical protein